MSPFEHPAFLSPLPLVTAADARLLRIPVGSRAWMRVRRGIYADRLAFEALPPWKRYEVRVHAYLRAYPEAVLCLESAAVIHGLPLFGESRDIHVFDPEGSTSRRFGDVAIHTSQDPRQLETHGGVRVTTLFETTVDLCRVLPPAHAIAVLDASLAPSQDSALSAAEILDRAESQANRRGTEQVRWATQRGTGLSESPAESVSRVVIEWGGFEPPDLQREFRYEGSNDRTDFYFPLGGVIGEVDGWQKYSLEDAARASAALTAEKRREDRLRRHGHHFARWELRDAWQADPLFRVLTTAGVQRVAPMQPAMLDSLRHWPRTRFRA